MFDPISTSPNPESYDVEHADYEKSVSQLLAKINQMTPEERANIDPKFVAFLVQFTQLPDEQRKHIAGNMKKSAVIAKQAAIALKNGFPCDCGGIMRYTWSRSLCYNPDKHVMYDCYDLKCEKCGKTDVFVTDLPHLQDEADNCRGRGLTDHHRLTHAVYSKASKEGRSLKIEPM